MSTGVGARGTVPDRPPHDHQPHGLRNCTTRVDTTLLCVAEASRRCISLSLCLPFWRWRMMLVPTRRVSIRPDGGSHDQQPRMAMLLTSETTDLALPNWACLIGCGALMSTPRNRVKNIPKVWIRIVRRRAGVVAFPRKGSILLLLGRDRPKTIDSFQKPPSSRIP
jgi:hypothetical protein